MAAIFCGLHSYAQTPIITMDTWQLVVKEGKPHYKFLDSATTSRLNYYLDDIQYEHPDGVKPFLFTTAIATFNAKEGFYFDKKLKLNEETPFLTESGNWRAYGLFASLATNPVEYKIKNLGVVNFNIDVTYTNVKEGRCLRRFQ